VDLTFTVRRAAPGVAVLAIAGEIDISSSPDLGAQITSLVDEGTHRLVLDLAGVDFIDSSGLGVLMIGRRRIQDGDGTIAIVVTRPNVLRVLTLSGISDVISVYPTVDEALAGYPGGPDPGPAAAEAPALPVTIYLSAADGHESVEFSVEHLLVAAGWRIGRRDQPVTGSWFRRLHAVAGPRAAYRGPLPDPELASRLTGGLAPVVQSLQAYDEALLRVGPVLIVRVDGTVTVLELSAVQQASLDQHSWLASSPSDALRAVRNLASGMSPAVSG
jgi:anti-anti-sigma factor